MCRSPIGAKAALAGLLMALLAGTAQADYYLTRVDVKTPAPLDPAVKVQTFTRPLALVALSNTSDRATRCRMDFSTGRIPAGSSERTVAAHQRWIERSPVAGPAGVIDVDVRCR